MEDFLHKIKSHILLPLPPSENIFKHFILNALCNTFKHIPAPKNTIVKVSLDGCGLLCVGSEYNEFIFNNFFNSQYLECLNNYSWLIYSCIIDSKQPIFEYLKGEKSSIYCNFPSFLLQNTKIETCKHGVIPVTCYF